jgi:hypothetical protein
LVPFVVEPRARLNCRGFEQVPGILYDPKSIAAPVVTLMTIRIVFVIMIMAGWTGHVLDVRGAFLKGDFADGENLYLNVPQGMEQHYSNNVYLHLCKTLYGMKQSAFRFWMFLLEIVKRLGCKIKGWSVSLLPMDGFRGPASVVFVGGWLLYYWADRVTFCIEENILKEVDCDDSGEIKEFVGCKIAYNAEMRTLVLMQSYEDEFNIATGHEVPKTPGVPFKALQLGAEPILQGERNTYFRSGVGKLMYMRRWSRLDLANALRDISRYNTNTTNTQN